MRFAYPLSILLGLVLALSGCGDDGSTPDPDMTVVEDDGGPSCDAPPEALMEATGTGVADVLAVPSGESRAGLVAAGVESLFQDQARQQTPHLDIAYQPTEESTFWRT